MTGDPGKKRARDPERTRQAILKSVGRLLARRGFLGVGVNAVAREAKVDKVLIYRYFGGLADLLRAYAAEGDFWPTDEDMRAAIAAAPPTLADGAGALLALHLRELRKRPATREIMRWELSQRNALTDELAAMRERQGNDLLQTLLPGSSGPDQAGGDLPAMAALLHAGLTYLVLRSRTADVYMGVDLSSEEGWDRLERAAKDAARACVAQATQGEVR